MGNRPILTLKKKAPTAVPHAPAAPTVDADPKPLSHQKLASAARAAAAEIEHREKEAMVAAARPVFEAYFQSFPVVQENRPLAIKVFYVFTNWMREQPIAAGFSGKMVQRTVEPVIAEHVKRPDYLMAVANGTHRYHLDGTPSELISDEHKDGAIKKLTILKRKDRKRIERMKTMDRDDAIKLLEEALNRLKHPTTNAIGKSCKIGGVYWRLAKVLEKHVEPLLDEYEGEHADFLRKNHGVITRVP